MVLKYIIHHLKENKILRLLIAVLIVIAIGVVICNYSYFYRKVMRKISKTSFYSDIYVWFPDDNIIKISQGDGKYFQSCINNEGTYVVYSGNSNGPPRIWIACLGTSEITPLTSMDYGARHPAFSWDGKKIIFSSDLASDHPPAQVEQMKPDGLPPKHHTTNIFSIDIESNKVIQITSGNYQDQRPCFSPDGKQVAFVSNRSGDYPSLWSVPSDGSKEPQPLQKDEGGYRPWYSVDGESIYFFSEINGRHQICKIPAEGGKLVPLTNDDSGMSHGPFADPNGKYILMHSTRKGGFKIWELPIDGSEPRLHHPPGFDVASHPTRSKNGIIAFDVIRYSR